MFKKILAATDLSAPSLEALREAARLAEANAGQLAVCHVLPSLVDVQPFFPQNYQEGMTAMAEFEANASREVQRRVGETLGERDVQIFTERGDAYADVLRIAESWGADLVVVASHGRTGLSRILLGSVAERIVRYAHVPVLVHRAAKGQGVVVAATDLSDPSLPAVSAGAAEARRRNARLALVHVLDQTSSAYAAAAGGLLGAIGALPPTGLQQETREALLTTLRNTLDAQRVPGDPYVLDGDPTAEIVRAAEKLGAELLVVGTHGRTGLSRLALGSVAERVVRAAPCPVLAVRMAPE